MEVNVWERHPPPSDVAWVAGLGLHLMERQPAAFTLSIPYMNIQGTLSTLVLPAPGRAAMSGVVTVESAMYRRLRVLTQKVKT